MNYARRRQDRESNVMDGINTTDTFRVGRHFSFDHFIIGYMSVGFTFSLLCPRPAFGFDSSAHYIFYRSFSSS